MDAQLVVGYHLLDVYLVHLAETLAVRTRTFRRVKGEHVWSRVLVCHASHGVHQSLGENLGSLVLVDDHHHTVTLFHGGGDALADTFFVLLLDSQLVDDHLYVMVLVSVDFHASGQLHDFAIYTCVEIALASHTLEEFAIVALALADERSEEVDAMTSVVVEYHVDDLFLGVFHHRLAAVIAVGGAGTSIEQA